MTDNLRGALLMTLSMAGFALEDMYIKWSAGSLGVGFVLFMMGLFGIFFFGALGWKDRAYFFSRDFFHPAVMVRNGSEIGATFCFVTALATAPLAISVVMIQALPLLVTLGAALFLGAPVGWQRWLAILIGLSGVLLILRPGTVAFEPAALWAVMAVIFFAARDVSTRQIPKRVKSSVVGLWALICITPGGFALTMIEGGIPTVSAFDAYALGGMILFGSLGYWAVIEAMRVGDIATVTPFRYTRLLFGMLIAVVIFGERPDAMTLTGCAIILVCGLFTLWREMRRPALAAHLEG